MANDDKVRRSTRLNPYDSNGREYLADQLGCTRRDLEEWIASAIVRPHLKLWYYTCILGARRFNDAIMWINSGENGYFYNSSELEEDLLLMCLCEDGSGNGTEGALGIEIETYATQGAKTNEWSTQELWARAAWRIIQANKGESQPFAELAGKDPAACYAFAIDLLCLAFHSIAFRGRASAYEGLIFGSNAPPCPPADVHSAQTEETSSLEEVDDNSSTASQKTDDSIPESDDHSSDGDFSDGTDATSIDAGSPNGKNK